MVKPLCINEQKSNDETPSDNSDGEEAQPKEFFDANGIDRLLSVSVVKKVSKDTNKEGVLSETVLHKVVNVADFVKHVSSINLEMKCNSLDCL